MIKTTMLLCLLVLFFPPDGKTQLLKKLKDKAAQAVAPKNSAPAATPASNNATVTEEQTDNQSYAAKWTPSPADTKAFSLAGGETFFYDETRISAANGKLSYAFIIGNNRYEYFLVEDGKRSGPYKNPPIDLLKARVEKADTEEGEGSSEEDAFNMAGEMKDPVSQQYSRTLNGKLHIVFNGKNFGPYDFINKMLVSPDKKRFWAVVVIGGENSMMAGMGMGKLFLVNEAGVKKEVPLQNAVPTHLYSSANFEAAALSVMGTDMQKAITISSTGKQLETNIAQLYNSRNPMVTVTDGGDIVSVPAQSPTQLLVNGKEVAVFKVPVKTMRRLFLLPDYAKTVYYQSGKLYRGDGSVEPLTGVVFPKLVSLNGELALYYFKVHQPDNSIKDVYLCKKTL